LGGCIAEALEKRKYIEIIRRARFRDVNIVSQNTFYESG
jgi:hypothetical protein